MTKLTKYLQGGRRGLGWALGAAPSSPSHPASRCLPWCQGEPVLACRVIRASFPASHHRAASAWSILGETLRARDAHGRGQVGQSPSEMWRAALDTETTSLSLRCCLQGHASDRAGKPAQMTSFIPKQWEFPAGVCRSRRGSLSECGEVWNGLNQQRRWEGWAQVMCTVFPGLSCMCFAKAAGQNLEGGPFARSLLENYLC